MKLPTDTVLCRCKNTQSTNELDQYGMWFVFVQENHVVDDIFRLLNVLSAWERIRATWYRKKEYIGNLTRLPSR